LFVLIKDSEVEYQGYLLNTDDDIEQFLDTFGITPAETNRPIEINRVNPEIREKKATFGTCGKRSVFMSTEIIAYLYVSVNLHRLKGLLLLSTSIHRLNLGQLFPR
jgi:hypothetical protein